MAGRAKQPTSAARPKRAGDDIAHIHDQASKAPRFDHRNPSTLVADAPEDEDVILDADTIGKGRKIKRNAVNIDGYESDSDDDNFDGRAKERAGNEVSKDEEVEDMFADLDEDMQGTADGDDDEELGREGKPRKKNVKFMESKDIEGQVESSKSGGHVSANLLMDGKQRDRVVSPDSDSESGDDEARDAIEAEMEHELAYEIGAGGKKKHAPRLDAFNIKDDEDDGRFDESGHFIRRAKDPAAEDDNWLDGLKKSDMRKAKEAEEKRTKERQKKDMESDAVLTSDALETLVAVIEAHETPLSALQRLNKSKPKVTKVPKWKQNRLKKNQMDVDEPKEDAAGPDPVEAARKKAIADITGAADALYSKGMHEIYETDSDKLKELMAEETGIPVADKVMWLFKWVGDKADGAVNGPYDVATMKAWNEAGYFSEGVEFKRVEEDEDDWSRLLDLSNRCVDPLERLVPRALTPH